VAAGIADQDVFAAAAECLRALLAMMVSWPPIPTSDDTLVALVMTVAVASLLVTIRRGVGERTAGRCIVDEQRIDKLTAVGPSERLDLASVLGLSNRRDLS